jgi:hypothetical protein
MIDIASGPSSASMSRGGPIHTESRAGGIEVVDPEDGVGTVASVGTVDGDGDDAPTAAPDGLAEPAHPATTTIATIATAATARIIG